MIYQWLVQKIFLVGDAFSGIIPVVGITKVRKIFFVAADEVERCGKRIEWNNMFWIGSEKCLQSVPLK
jgi:hypothetical protein